MIKINRKWQPHQFAIETNGVGMAFWKYALNHGLPNVVSRYTKEKKEVRALPIQGLWNNGKIYWSYYNDEVIREVCGFPNSDHDDVVDAISGCYQLLLGGNEVIPPPTIHHTIG